jgi:rhodanese-related sulfurtransferase
MLLLFTFIIISISRAVESPKKSFFEAPPRITLEELKGKLDQKADAIVVDVRGNLSFEQEHIKGAIYIPLEEIEEGKREFPKDKEIVFY